MLKLFHGEIAAIAAAAALEDNSKVVLFVINPVAVFP